MRKILLMLFALCSIIAMAQDRGYRPFCEEGKCWEIDNGGIAFATTWRIEKESLQGDTLIDGRKCKKLISGSLYKGAFFDEGLKTFYIPQGSNVPLKVYDFSLQVGEQCECYDMYLSSTIVYTVVSIRTDNYEGHTYKVIDLIGEETLPLHTQSVIVSWYEGIGAARKIKADNADVHWALFRKCELDDECIFMNEADYLPFGYLEEEGFGVECEHLPFSQKEKVWLVKEADQNQDSKILVYTLANDTIIAGQSALCMFCDGNYIGAFFDKWYQTYYIAPNETTPHLFYNFCLWGYDCTRVWNGKQWATLACRVAGPYFPRGRNKQNMNFLEIEDDSVLRLYNTFDLLCTDVGIWYEGVGSLYGPMNNWMSPLEDCGIRNELLACWTPDEIIYDPQGLAAAHFMTIPMATSPFYDLSGRKMAAPSAHGIYIEGGKKVVR